MSEWTKWEGGRNSPIDNPETIVHIRVKSGIYRVPCEAKYWPNICWNWRDDSDPKSCWNIVGYKIV